MWIKNLRYVALLSLPFLMSIHSRSVGPGMPGKVVVLVEEDERVGQNEAHFRVKVTNISGKPVFSTGINSDSRHRSLDIYLEQQRGKEGWQLVVPCRDMAPPHVIKLDPAVPMVVERTLKVPLGSICKKRDIQLEGQFRYRVDYFESRAEARLYLKKFFSKGDDKPHPASAFSEPFEIPPFREPPEARPNR